MNFFSTWEEMSNSLQTRKEVYEDIDRYVTTYAHISTCRTDDFRIEISTWGCDRTHNINKYEQDYILREVNNLAQGMLGAKCDNPKDSIRFHAYSLFQAAEQADDLPIALAMIDGYREQLIKQIEEMKTKNG